MSELIRSTNDEAVQLRVEPDGQFVVRVAGDIIFATRVRSAADIYYEEEAEKRRSQSPKRQRLAKERAHFDMQAVRSDSFARRSAHQQKKGGKGGRGGV